MRTPLVFLVVAACSSDPVMGGGEPDGGGGGGGGAGGPAAPAHVVRIESPEIVLAPGEEATYCYYTTLTNEQALGVKRWRSTMTPGSHHLILFLTREANQPDGTLSEDCGFATSISNVPIWAYSAQDPEADFEMPEGIGMAIDARQHLFVQMHYLNSGSEELRAHVVIDGEVYEQGASFEQAYAYITYNTEIDLDDGEEASFGGTCDVPAGKQFFTMSTHTHQYATSAVVQDGSDMLVETDDWEHPDVARWDSPFYTFQGPLTYRCTYRNTSGGRVQTGDSARTDEMCMAVGYFFPATSPVLCVNSFVVPF